MSGRGTETQTCMKTCFLGNEKSASYFAALALRHKMGQIRDSVSEWTHHGKILL